MTASPDPSTLMTTIVSDRQRMWRLVGDVVLADGSLAGDGVIAWAAALAEAAAWTEATERFERLAREVTAVAPPTAAELDLARAAIGPIADEVTSLLGALAVALEAEQQAWRSGDLDRARSLRATQHDQINGRLALAVQEWCFAADSQRHSPALATAMHGVVSVLSIESGRDFDSMLSGRGFRIVDLLTERPD